MLPDAPQHARVLPRGGRVPALVLAGALAAGAAAAGAFYLDLRGRLDVSDAQSLVLASPVEQSAAPEDPFAGKAMNVLVMGTDVRDEENAALAGEAEGMRSDTTMLVHVSGDRTWAEVVSVPRDSLVEVPECRLPDGSTSRARTTMFNEAFQIGAGDAEDLDHAAACTISTVQAATGLQVTNHVVVKMAGVIDVVDALHGVRMCLPEPVVESRAYGSLDLPAGEQRLDGRQAIGFLRARHGTGLGLEMGSDLTRIARQQAFVQAAVRELLAKDVLGDADELYGVARAVLGSLSADPELADPVRMASFGYSLRGMDRSRIVFTELPVVPAASDPNRVEWAAGADEIWQRLASDTPPPSLAPAQAAGGEAGDGAAAGQTADGGAGAAGEDDAAGQGGTAGQDGASGQAGPAGQDGTAGQDAAGSPDPGTQGSAGLGGALGDELLPGVCAA